MLIEVSSNIRSNYMLHHLAQYTSQGDGPIIGGITFLTFLENGAYIGFSPVRRKCTSGLARDFSKISWMTGAISTLNSLSTMGLISSGPAALSGRKL